MVYVDGDNRVFLHNLYQMLRKRCSRRPKALPDPRGLAAGRVNRLSRNERLTGNTPWTPCRERVVLIHYHEIGLKGRNRGRFEQQLLTNIARASKGLPRGAVRRLSGRIVLELSPDTETGAILERLADVFGIANYSEAVRVPNAIEHTKGRGVGALPGARTSARSRSRPAAATRAFRSRPRRSTATSAPTSSPSRGRR